MSNLNNKKIIIVLGGIIIGVIGYFLFNYFEYGKIEENKFEENDILIKYNDGNTENELNDVEKDDQSPDKILIHIVGEVVNPGIVELKEGDRIFNAISEAGGTTKDADTSKINLAELVQDGMKIVVPNKNDKYEDIYNTNNQVIVNNKTNENNGIKIVNINTANKEELETLPGIGESTALKIISYRKDKGKFSKIEDIKNVSGIGDAKFEKIKKYITVK